MAIDQPIVVYDHKKGKKGKGEKREFTAPSASAMEKARLQYEQIKAERAKKAAEDNTEAVITNNGGDNTLNKQ